MILYIKVSWLSLYFYNHEYEKPNSYNKMIRLLRKIGVEVVNGRIKVRGIKKVLQEFANIELLQKTTDKEVIELKDNFTLKEIAKGAGTTGKALYFIVRDFNIKTTQEFYRGPLRVDRRERERLLACSALRKETGMHTHAIKKLSNEFIMQILSKL